MLPRLACLAAIAALAVGAARGQADFLQSFDNPTGDNGQVVFRGDAIYLATGATPSGGDKNGKDDENYRTGFIISKTSELNFDFGVIDKDQGGAGHFLYEGTHNRAITQGLIPNYLGTFWQIYEATPVTANADYVLSFYLTNSNITSAGVPAKIRPMINGAALGAQADAVALGYYDDNVNGHQWQRFSYLWNPGAATAADVQLVNMQPAGNGNDFAVDSIALTKVSADFNASGRVEGTDFLAWQRGFGSVGTAIRATGDADVDLDVDAADFVLWRNRFGEASAATAAPEPGGAALCGWMVMIGAGVRRRSTALRLAA